MLLQQKKSKLKCYKFLLWKRYFEIGYGITGYIKYLIAAVGIASVIAEYPFYYVAIAGLIYGVSCFILGWIWIKFDLYKTENEITNQFNPFVYQMRNKFKIEKFK